MTRVSIQDLRNQAGDVVDRAACGEHITVTRSGKAVAELRAVPRTPVSAEALLANWRRLPPLSPNALRPDRDDLLEAGV
jgi:antitoxin (DNA-binding transcriptional repressor) of toxin-antitoxin stability system